MGENKLTAGYERGVVSAVHNTWCILLPVRIDAILMTEHHFVPSPDQGWTKPKFF